MRPASESMSIRSGNPCAPISKFACSFATVKPIVPNAPLPLDDLPAPDAVEVLPKSPPGATEATTALSALPTPAAGPHARNDEDDDGGEGEDDGTDLDEDDEELVVYTAREAAGALATIYAFIWPSLRN